jgi:hypothetical protein
MTNGIRQKSAVNVTSEYPITSKAILSPLLNLDGMAAILSG